MKKLKNRCKYFLLTIRIFLLVVLCAIYEITFSFISLYICLNKIVWKREKLQKFRGSLSTFSAVETEKSRSSMVAINVVSFPLHFILVNTSSSFNVVLICKPLGTLKLSGETALAIASASLLSSYRKDISASTVFTF